MKGLAIAAGVIAVGAVAYFILTGKQADTTGTETVSEMGGVASVFPGQTQPLLVMQETQALAKISQGEYTSYAQELAAKNTAGGTSLISNAIEASHASARNSMFLEAIAKPNPLNPQEITASLAYLRDSTGETWNRAETLAVMAVRQKVQREDAKVMAAEKEKQIAEYYSYKLGHTEDASRAKSIATGTKGSVSVIYAAKPGYSAAAEGKMVNGTWVYNPGKSPAEKAAASKSTKSTAKYDSKDEARANSGGGGVKKIGGKWVSA